MTESQDDEREEELSSLTAIYPEELTRDSKDPYSVFIDLLVEPISPLKVAFPPLADCPPPTTFASTVAGIKTTPKHDSHSLSFLPPLHLEITLPEGYPSELPPHLKLTTSPAWLPRKVLQQLQDEARRLWEEYGHEQVLFSYISYLQETSERGFDLADKEDGILELPQDLKIALLDFDIKAKKKKFEKESHDCGICLEPKNGKLCYQMRRCGHVFCTACLRDFYNNCISEGDVNGVRCLSPDCGKEKTSGKTEHRKKKKKERLLSPNELLQIPLEHSIVKRYVDLKRKKKLESDKSTIYCPRKWCQGAARSKKYPKIEDISQLVDSASESEAEEQDVDEGMKPTGSKDSDRLAICEDCNYAFCRVCLGGWHGEFVRCWPREASELTEEERASLNYILAHTSPCPTCSVPCQKTHGCNHMSCFQCKSHFCYLCSSWLDPGNPYEHFNNPSKQCYMRLWELEEGDDGNGNVQFDGVRGAEAAAQRAAAAAAQIQQEEIEAAEREQGQAGGAEVIVINMVNLGLDRNWPPPPAPEPPRPDGRPQNAAPPVAQYAQPAVRDLGPQRPIHNGGGRAARVEPNQQGLQRFLQMVRDDVEDEWDSDELDEDDEEFRIPERD